MKIRRGTAEDGAAIAALVREFYNSTYYAEAGVKFSPRTFSALLAFLLSGNNGIVAVAEEGDAIVGFILMAVFPFPFNNKVLAASELAYYVTPEHREGGVGHSLLSKAEQVAKQMGAKFVTMVALESGTPAAASTVYERLGYRKNETSFTKDY